MAAVQGLTQEQFVRWFEGTKGGRRLDELLLQLTEGFDARTVRRLTNLGSISLPEIYNTTVAHKLDSDWIGYRGCCLRTAIQEMP